MSLLLLVEGPDDQYVSGNLLAANDIRLDPPSGIRSCGGIERLLRDVLPATLRAATHRAIGVIVDADADITARWEALRYRLIEAGYTPPPVPDASGTIVRGERAVGLWLMPDNKLPGTLEQFVSKLIPDGDELFPVARAAVAAIPQHLRRFASTSAAKAELHTYLAWQEEPGTPRGAGIAKRYFATTNETAGHFVDWVKRLRGLGQV